MLEGNRQNRHMAKRTISQTDEEGENEEKEDACEVYGWNCHCAVKLTHEWAVTRRAGKNASVRSPTKEQ